MGRDCESAVEGRGVRLAKGRVAWAALVVASVVLLAGILPPSAAAHTLKSASHGPGHGPAAGLHAALSESAASNPAHSGWVLLTVLVLAGFGLDLLRRHAKEAAMLALALVIGLFAVEAAVHSVHHLSEPDAAARCLVLSVSQHLEGTCLELPTVAVPAPTQHPVRVDDVPSIARSERFRSDAGRAPPTPPSV